MTVAGGWRARVLVKVVDQHGHPVQGAVVTGAWPNGTTTTCTTGSAGTCTIGRKLASSKRSILFTVKGVTSLAGAYAPAKNGDTDGDSTGTKITLRKP
jgi:hypothetical protein